LIQGPPGTGKTQTIRGIISMIYEKCNKILVCTPSNKAVDEILKRIHFQGLLGAKVKHTDMVRIGSANYEPDECI
jgi:DNA polymerase alpha-associated DNA helicase A